MIVEKHTVEKVANRQSIYTYLPGKSKKILSRKGIKKALSRGDVFVNGQKATFDTPVKNGDQITIEEHLVVHHIYEAPLTVHFEDEHLALIEKPAGWVVSGNQFKTILNALPYNLKKSKKEDALLHPLPVHRLDQPTHGLLLIAKTYSASVQLSQLFEERKIKKKYIALIHGFLNSNGNITSPINGKKSATYFRTIDQQKNKRGNHLTLIELRPKTGRKHQLRIHLSRLGFPIVGDKKYKKEEPHVKNKGLFLSAVGLQFVHPVHKEKIKIEIDLPKKFQRFLRLNSRQ